jgi:hypothetical protein|tara:strand:+ start:320 stop:436 length:117 start_codon:yes stop_codon:yes gene_type:complete
LNDFDAGEQGGLELAAGFQKDEKLFLFDLRFSIASYMP